MPEEVFILSLAAIVFGTGLIGLILHNIFSIVKTKMNQKSGSGEINPQFFKALGEFKKSTERRIANLETIINEYEEEKILISDKSGTGDIEIEDEEVRGESDSKENNNLRNMLNE